MRSQPLWLVCFLSLFAGCTSAATKQSLHAYENGRYQDAAAAADRGIAADRSDRDAWRMRLRAALALGDAAGIAAIYAQYRQSLAGEDDLQLVTELAQATLAQGLTSPSVALRIAAIRAVEDSELFDLADAVAERMSDRDDRVVATAAVAVLRGYGDAANALDDMLHSEVAEARRIAVDGLGRKIAKLAIADLVAAAADSDASVRRAALSRLAVLRDPRLAPLFVQHFGDRDDGVRGAAVHGLVGLARSSSAIGKSTAVAAIRDRALGVRLGAVELLSALADRPALLALLADEEATVALEAASALRSPPTIVAPIMERALASRQWTTRVTALNQLTSALGPAVAIAKARVAATDPEIAVRLAAARVLAHAGARPEAIAILVATVNRGDATGSDARILEAAADLAQLGDERGETALARAVRMDASAQIRARAADAHRLARTITPGLVAALADRSGTVRIAAAAALAATAKARSE
jgi:HEAT repeat protein